MKSGDLPVDLATAFDASPNLYMVVTPDLRFAGANLAYLKTMGVTREDLIGRPVFEVFDSGPGEDAPENVRQVKASIERVLETGEADHLALVRFSAPFRNQNGRIELRERSWSASHTPFKSGDNGVLHVLQHTVDITELEQLRGQNRSPRAQQSSSALDAIIGGKVLERARQVQEDNQRLEVERNRLIEMFMQAPGFVAVLSGPDHVFQLHNQAYANLTGHRDLDGKPVIEALPELIDQGYVGMLDGVFATGKAVHGRDSLFRRRLRADGPLEDIYLDFVYQPIRDSAGFSSIGQWRRERPGDWSSPGGKSAGLWCSNPAVAASARA